MVEARKKTRSRVSAGGRQQRPLGQRFGMSIDLLTGLSLALAATSFLLGGASRENEGLLAVVELSALPLLCVAGGRLYLSGQWRNHIAALLLMGAVLLLPLIQLIPLPYGVWTALPQREALAGALEAAGAGRPWAPLSLTPEFTLAVFLGLLPPAAMFLAALQLTPRAQRGIVGVYIALAAVSVLIGLFQAFGDLSGALYPYKTTNYGSPVGLFANRNHLATLLLATLPLAGLFLAETGSGQTDRSKLVIAGAALFTLIALVGLIAIESRAGILLAGPALIALLLVARKTGRRRGSNGRWHLVAGGALAMASVVVVFAIEPILKRFGAPPEVGRADAWQTIAQAAGAYMPFGGGFGAFDTVYRSVEPLSRVAPNYFNHAHNDYLELWLEGGLLGLLLLLAALVWLGVETVRTWRNREGSALSLAVTASIALVLLHSAVDYPLRTQTMAVLFAFCCGVIANGRVLSPERRRSRRRRPPEGSGIDRENVEA
ncbi:O-antigen ligase family protein [Caulobacter mirabilis]|uniref:O-antigen ligase-related domain-containing protein n=1 Tax=Caulobacter mirabilis TaxID=69666 RepID=A0A2D2ASZ6_9CAUL|nr:O-antigen ligase family protein [Caulobacter mirabilis]ATQ41130.1 hypothetical protein CSW64_01250 [Caulobacter mirabilis]